MRTLIDVDAVKRSWAALIKATRIERGLTQQDAAHELGVAIKTYQLWETKGQLPDPAKALQVELLWGIRVPLIPLESTPS